MSRNRNNQTNNQQQTMNQANSNNSTEATKVETATAEEAKAAEAVTEATVAETAATEAKVETTETATAAPATDAPAAPVPEPAPTPEPAPAPAPVTIPAAPTPLERPKHAVHGRAGIPLAKYEEAASVNDIVQKAQESNNMPLQTLAGTLATLETKLSARVQIPLDEVAKQMAGLYSMMINTIETTKTNGDFHQAWTLILKSFKENENGGFSPARTSRGVAFWQKSHENYVHYQSLLNLIYVTNNVPKDKWRSQLNFTKLTQGLSDQGRGRLLSFYM